MARSTKEGVGETSGQTAGSLFEEFALLKTDPAEETGFLRSVRILRSAISQGPKPRSNSGPDVFADALVPCRLPIASGVPIPNLLTASSWPATAPQAGAFFTSAFPRSVANPTAGAGGVVGMPQRHQSPMPWIVDQPAVGLSWGARVAATGWRVRATSGTDVFAADGYRFPKWHGKPNS